MCVSEISTCCGRSISKNGSFETSFVIEFNEFELLERRHDLLLTSSVGLSPHSKYWDKNPDYPPEIILAISSLITNRRTKSTNAKLDRKKHFKQSVYYIMKVR
jgi:hypothetical protein